MNNDPVVEGAAGCFALLILMVLIALMVATL